VAAIVGLAFGIFVGLIRPKSYVARASFIAEQPKVTSIPSGLGALAAQFGLDIGSDAGRSPQFYRELITTTGLLRSLLDSLVPISADKSSTIRELLGGDSDTSRISTDRVLRRLRERIQADADARTSVVAFKIRATTPTTAERMAMIVLGGIRHFNVTTRQLQARERREFLEGRVADAYQTLRTAEAALRDFYLRNRRFEESPTLVFEESRMKRVITLQQELYTSLSKELETARIQEVNDTPTITLVDPPFASSKPSGPSVAVLAVFFAALGLGGAVVWFIAKTGVRSLEPVDHSSPQ